MDTPLILLAVYMAVTVPLLIAYDARWTRVCHRLGLSSRVSLREVEEEIERLKRAKEE